MSGRRAKKLRHEALRMRGNDPGEHAFIDRAGTVYGPRWIRLYRASKRAWNRGQR